MSPLCFRATRLGWTAMVFLSVCWGRPVHGAETNALPDAGAVAKQGTNLPTALDAELQLRTYLKLQEQLHLTLLAIDQAREEASRESRTNAEALAERLELLERSLSTQREQEWQSAQHSNRTLLFLAGGIIGLGFLALVFTAIFQSRGMNRLAEIATTLSQDRPLLPALPPALADGDSFLLGNGAATPAPRALLATVAQLQQRIQDLERSTHPTQSAVLSATLPGSAEPRAASARNGGARSRPLDHASALVGKAQVLLSLNQVEEALACYDQALSEAPDQADTHLRRGQTLEKLKRYEEAVESYDQAIALNPHLTQAYLCKGAVCNQQERYSEALACYEQALRAETND